VWGGGALPGLLDLLIGAMRSKDSAINDKISGQITSASIGITGSAFAEGKLHMNSSIPYGIEVSFQKYLLS
jgi:hypothetical protein